MRILSYGDNPLTSTGYGTVWFNLLRDWAKLRPDWEFMHVGWQSRDRPHKTVEGYTMLPMKQNEYGYDTVYKYLMDYKPDFLVTLCDVGWQAGYIEHVFKAKQAGWKGKWIAYTPVDTHEWTMTWDETFDAPDINVAMAQFGYDVMKKHNVKNPYLIKHGVDLESFKPMDKEAMKERFGLGGKFTVGFVGRNQIRKMIDRILFGFKIFAEGKDDVALVLHTDQEPPQQGWSLPYMQWKLKIEDKLKLTKTNLDIIGRQMLQPSNMNDIYNMMNVFCYGTGGEGFGLPGIECQAAGVPLLMTDCTTALDLCRDENKIPVLKDCHGRDVDIVGTNGVTFKVPDDIEIAKLLERYYQEWKTNRQKLFEREAEARVFAQQYDWSLISPKWIELFEKES